jgi:signal transduction histidine kinase
MKSDFVSIASHELRTPLTSIKGYLDLVIHGNAGAITTQQEFPLPAPSV